MAVVQLMTMRESQLQTTIQGPVLVLHQGMLFRFFCIHLCLFLSLFLFFSAPGTFERSGLLGILVIVPCPEMPLNDDPAHKEFILQRYRERIEKLSQQDRLSKFCTDAGFLTTVESDSTS